MKIKAEIVIEAERLLARRETPSEIGMQETIVHLPTQERQTAGQRHQSHREKLKVVLHSLIMTWHLQARDVVDRVEI